MNAVTQKPAGLQLPSGIRAEALFIPATRKHSFNSTLGPRLIKTDGYISYAWMNSEQVRGTILVTNLYEEVLPHFP